MSFQWLITLHQRTYSNPISTVVNCAMKNLPSCIDLMNCFTITSLGIAFQPFLQK